MISLTRNGNIDSALETNWVKLFGYGSLMLEYALSAFDMTAQVRISATTVSTPWRSYA
jgi:hypothetical protein